MKTGRVKLSSGSATDWKNIKRGEMILFLRICVRNLGWFSFLSDNFYLKYQTK